MLERVPSRAEGRAGGISPADALDRASEIAQSMANDLDSTRDMPLHRGGWIDIVLRGDEGFDFRVETAASLLMNAVKWSTVTLDLPAGIPSRGVHLVRRAAELFTTWETQAQRPDAFDLAVRADADASEQEATARHFRTLRQQEDLLQVFDAVADGIVVWQGCPYQSAHRAAITEGLDLCRSIAAAIMKGEDRSFVVGREVRTEDGPGVSWAMMVARLKRELVMARVKLVGQNAWPSQQVVYHVMVPRQATALPRTSERIQLRLGSTAPTSATNDLVTRDQLAGVAKVAKKTIVRWRNKFKATDPMPEPKRRGKNGQADLFSYAEVRPWLERRADMKLPMLHPSGH